MAKKAKAKKEKLPVPRLEFDETCGNVTLRYKKINNSDDNVLDGACSMELVDGESLDWTKKLAKQLNLPLYATISRKERVA